MTGMQTAREVTAQEFLELPQRGKRGKLQLVDGELVTYEPDMRHNVVQVRLLSALLRWVETGAERGRVCVPLDVLIDERNMFEPDVSWYSVARTPAVEAPRPYPVPDLAVEVRSPSTWKHDVGPKRAGYERHGLAELWLVDTAADQVLVFRRSKAGGRSFDVALELGSGEALRCPLLPGFALALDELFPAR